LCREDFNISYKGNANTLPLRNWNEANLPEPLAMVSLGAWLVVWLLSVVVGRVGVVVVVVVVVGCCTHTPAVACVVCVVAVAVGARGQPEGLRHAGAAANMLGAEVGAFALLHRCQRYQQSLVWCGVVWCGVVWCGVVWCGVVW
jgi:hypothetical protein